MLVSSSLSSSSSNFERPAFNVSRQNPPHVSDCPQRQWFYAADLFSITPYRKVVSEVEVFPLYQHCLPNWLHYFFSSRCYKRRFIWILVYTIILQLQRNLEETLSSPGAPATDSDFDFLLLWHLMEWISSLLLLPPLSPLCSAALVGIPNLIFLLLTFLVGHGLKYSLGLMLYCGFVGRVGEKFEYLWETNWSLQLGQFCHEIHHKSIATCSAKEQNILPWLLYVVQWGLHFRMLKNENKTLPLF